MEKIFNDNIGSESVRLMRIGFADHRGNISNQKSLVSHLSNLCSQFNVKLGHDIVYDGYPSELSYHEIFGTAGGVMITPCDFKAKNQMVISAMLNSAIDNEKVQRVTALNDKYGSFKPFHYPARIALVAGSNIFKRNTHRALLLDAVEKGAWIKPHPLMNFVDYKELLKEFGSVFPPICSAVKLIHGCKVVYATGDSELALLSILLDKIVFNISDNKGAFSHYFEWALGSPNPKVYLSRIVSNPESGICFTIEDVEKFFQYFLKNHFDTKKPPSLDV